MVAADSSFLSIPKSRLATPLLVAACREFDKSTTEGVQRADELFQKLLTQLQTTVDATRQDEPYERIMELEIIITNLKVWFLYYRFC